MAGHNWELVRDLSLADYRADDGEAARLRALIKAGQDRCSHVPNPEHTERCYKCGHVFEAHAAVPAPLAKARRRPLDLQRRETGT